MVATTNANESVKVRYDAKKNQYQRRSYIDKDEDIETRNTRRNKSNEPKSKGASGIELEQSDKMEMIRRLERDKKAKQKKLREEEEIEKQKRPQIKHKRNSKSDWTKDYVYGLLDEESDYLDNFK